MLKVRIARYSGLHITKDRILLPRCLKGLFVEGPVACHSRARAWGSRPWSQTCFQPAQLRASGFYVLRFKALGL